MTHSFRSTGSADVGSPSVGEAFLLSVRRPNTIGISLNVLIFILVFVFFPVGALAIGAFMGTDKLLYRQTARVQRMVGQIINWRVPGLLIASAIWVGVVLVPITVLERARYGQLSLRVKNSVVAILALALLILVPKVVHEYPLFIVSQCILFSLVVLSINITLGYLGELSLGHGTFVLIGALSAGYVLSDIDSPTLWKCLLAVFVGGCSASVLGVLVGLPTARLSGVYFSLVTVALSISAPLVLKSHYLESFTGGTLGVSINKPTAPASLAVSEESLSFWVVVVPSLVVFMVVASLLRGSFGKKLRAIRDSEVAAQMVGLSLPIMKLKAFALSAFVAGVAGALSAMQMGFVSSDNFGLFESIAFVVASVLGGAASVVGALFGGVYLALQSDLNALLVKLIPHGDDLRWALNGLIVIIVILFARRGLIGLIYKKFE